MDKDMGSERPGYRDAVTEGQKEIYDTSLGLLTLHTHVD